MNADAEQLAADLEAANDEVMAFVESCTDGQWTTMVVGENWPVGVVVHHIAVGHLQMIDWLGMARAGTDITKTAAEIDADNERHARQYTGVNQDDTVEELRYHGATLAELIRALDAEELARSVSFGPANGMAVTTQELASVSARHCAGHLADARGALESGVS